MGFADARRPGFWLALTVVFYFGMCVTGAVTGSVWPLFGLVPSTISLVMAAYTGTKDDD